MLTFFTSYLNNLQELHDEIRNAIKGLSQSALGWTSLPDMNSVSVLVIHLTGAERYWIGDVIAGEPSGRDRECEFKTKALSEGELIQHLIENEKYIERILERLILQDLEEKHISPRNGREVTAGWALGHVLKHTALHVGHIQIMRQLWEQSQTKQ